MALCYIYVYVFYNLIIASSQAPPPSVLAFSPSVTNVQQYRYTADKCTVAVLWQGLSPSFNATFNSCSWHLSE